MIVFPFLGAGFANIPLTFFISCEVQAKYSKTLKYAEQYIRDHLSDTKVRFGFVLNMILFLIFLHCLVQPNQAMHFIFHIIFIIRIRLWIFKQSTCTLYASEISLFKVFINACKLTGEMQIDWSFFLGVWHSVNSLSVSVTD